MEDDEVSEKEVLARPHYKPDTVKNIIPFKGERDGSSLKM
jgi:hypothetical protein